MVRLLDLLREIKVVLPGEEYRRVFEKAEMPDSEFKIFLNSIRSENVGQKSVTAVSDREVDGTSDILNLLQKIQAPNVKYIIELLNLLPVSHTHTKRTYKVLKSFQGTMSYYCKSNIYLEYQSPYFYTDEPVYAFSVWITMSNSVLFPNSRVQLVNSVNFEPSFRTYDSQLLLELFKEDQEEFYETLKIY